MDIVLQVPTVDERTRIPMDVIQELARRIAAEFHPQKIILFGSYAYGDPRPESDVDLFVVMDTTLREPQQALKIREYLNPLFGLDILVYTPAKLTQRLAWGDSFLREIVDRGVVLYETADA
jgi:predicted nucleotidyltransferase